MRLRLTYDGQLLSGGKETPNRRAHKHDIRRRFHVQLQKYWTIHPHLIFQLAHNTSGQSLSKFPGQSIAEHISDGFRRQSGFRFLPLVRENSNLMCTLEILYLRRNKPGSIFTNTDIDNRLKTLFDALKVPKDGKEFPDASPLEGEAPFFCLLEDDTLVTRVSVETDYLLEPVGCPKCGDQEDQNDARIVIFVELRPYTQTLGVIDANIGYA